MIKHLTTLFLATFFCITFGQIPNAGMELWDSQPVLIGWNTNSYPLTMPPYNPYIIRQDTASYAGNYAANFCGNGVLNPIATTTFPISVHPNTLSLYYRLSFPPCVNDVGWAQRDTVSILVEILNNGLAVDTGSWQSTISHVSYAQLIIPVSQNASLFDSCRITIKGGKVFGGCGFAAAATEFRVDELQLNYSTVCEKTGVVVQGAECKLIDTGSVNLLMPCNYSLHQLGFIAGDTIHFSFIPSTCISFCMQGTEVELTCIDTNIIHHGCSLSVVLNGHAPTSHLAGNGSIQCEVFNAVNPVHYLWNTGSTADSIAGLYEGSYCVTVSDANNCTASACDTLFGNNVCIDSSLICDMTFCCDFFPPGAVCGCDSVTYTSSCEASAVGGVTSYYAGPCVTTGITHVSSKESEITISPNPVSSTLHLQYLLKKPAKSQINIINPIGETVKTVNAGFFNAGQISIHVDLTELHSGFYLIEVKTEEETMTSRFVKD